MQNIDEIIKENLKYKRQLELSSEVSGHVFWEFDFKTNMFTFNYYYYKFLNTTVETENGYEKSVDNYFESFIPDSSQQIVIDIITEAFKRDKDYYSSFEYEMRRRDGKILQVLVDLYISYDKEGNPDKSYGTKYDLTKRKLYENSLKLEKENIELTNKLQIEELKQKDELLIQQSKMASMGEMISSIAHQWRQPLNALGLTVQKIKLYYDENLLTSDNLNKSIEKSNMIVNKMSDTIDDFRNFFKIDKKEEEFSIYDSINNSLSIVDSSLIKYNIKVDISKWQEEIKYFGVKNELEQVLINIIINAKDALKENNISNPKIQIKISKTDDKTVIKISDNALGIPEENIENIFKSYFTTKGEDKGTGIGLYMSKMIIEDTMNGTLSVENINDGACFIIEI